MRNRSHRTTAVVVLVALVFGLATALSPSTPAGAAAQSFELDLVEGELLLRDAEEPYALGQPTSIGGQHDTGDGGTGAVTAGTFTSPPISFETEALGQPVFVDATFSQVTPGSGTGSIDAEGNVAYRTELTVDLHIEVNSPPALVQECRATPVSIALDSVAPYDPETGRVTVRDADFSVPAVPTSDTCISLVASNVNTLLAGSGHSLTMALEGDVDLPPPAGCPTTTALTVTPSSSFLSDDVTLEATVVAAPEDIPECADAEGVVPAGSVELLSDGAIIGVADLDGTGVATLVTDDLPTGDLTLTARYRGQPPYSASTSEAVAHVVAARPTIEADVPSAFVIGAAPTEFDVTISNSGLGAEVVNARLDFGIRRTDSTAPLAPTRVAVERFDGTTWVPATMVSSPFTFGSVMPAVGIPLPVGAEVTQRVRLAATTGNPPVPVEITFELVPVDPGTGEPAPVLPPAASAVARASIPSFFVEGARRSTTLALTAPTPHTLRRGMVARTSVNLQRPSGGPNPAGTYEVLFDGVPVPVRSQRTPPEFGYQPTMPVRDSNGATAPKFVVPANAAPGTRQVTIRYSGDSFYAPSQLTVPITVLADRGPTYECINQNLVFADRFNIQVDAFALVPAAARPGARPLPLLDVQVYGDRGDAVQNYANFFPASVPVLPPGSTDNGVRTARLDFGPAGEGTATAVTFTNDTVMSNSTLPVDPNPDMVIGFTGETASLTIDGAPGDVVPVALESITLNAVISGLGVDLTCRPLGDPAELGETIVAGTTLEVEAPEPTREGDDVTLKVQVAPAGTPGTVELLDGDDTLGAVAVDNAGAASFTTDDLAAGEHTLTAEFRTALAGLSSTSAPVSLVVAEAAVCPPDDPESAHGAFVRLLYLTALERCPTDSEADYWVGRLEAGATYSSVVRAITGSVEATERLVEAGYQRVLQRAADTAGRDYWVAALRGGYRYDRFLASLAASAEFYGAGGDDEGFVTRLYQRILEREPDASGLSYWVGQLASGVPRWRIALSFTSVIEVRQRLVIEIYQRLLDRAPTGEELAAAANRLRGNGDLAGVVALVASAPEFAERALELPNPPAP